jgi:glycosyltransferase involved in cell wall biosynthesis
MRILHVSDCFLPRLGGIELHVRDLSDRQRAQGHDVSVLTATPPGNAPAESSAGRQEFVILQHQLRSAGLRKLMASGGFDVVHAHTSLISPLAWNAARIAAHLEIPCVLTMHSMVPRGLLSGIVQPLLSRTPDTILLTAVSTAAATALSEAFADRDVRVLPNGIDPGEWLTPDRAIAAQPPLIASVLRMVHRKRPLPLVRVLAAIRDQIPRSQPFRAVVVGSGPLENAFSRKLANSGLAGFVRQTGSLTRSQLKILLARADIYLAPATLESFGLAALEARCAGLAVIGRTGGGMTDFIRNGKEGFLVESDAAMADCTARLISDRDALRRLQAHNRRTSPTMTWPYVLRLHHLAYRAAGARQDRDLVLGWPPQGTASVTV